MTEHDELVDGIAAAVRAVPGVVDLHAGALGEAVTLLPGRRVAGLRITDDQVEVHLAVAHGESVRGVADDVRAAVAAMRPGPVTVVVEDVVRDAPDDPPTAPAPQNSPEPILPERSS